jgi:O-antigen ligase
LVLYFASAPLDGVLPVYGLGGFGPMVVAGMILVLLFTVLRGGLDRRVLTALPLIVLLWWSAVTLFWSDTPSVAARSLVVQVYLVLPVVFAFGCPLPPAWRRLCIVTLSASVCVTITYGAYAVLSFGGLRWAGRLSVSDDYNPSWLAAQAGLVVLLAVCALTSWSRRTSRLIWSLAGTFAFLGLLATQGRNALIALIGTLVLVFGPRLQMRMFQFFSGGWIARRHIRSMALGASLVIVMSALSIAAFVELASRYPGVISFERIARLFSGDSDLATAGRTILWADYLSILADSHIWLLGAGIWSASDVHLTFAGSSLPPHNVFLSLLVELGLPGLFLYLLALLALARVALRLTGPDGVMAAAVLVYSFLLGFGNDVLLYKYFWLGLTLVAVLSAQSRARARGRVRRENAWEGHPSPSGP